MTWWGDSISGFVRGPLARTLEGWLVILGCVACALTAVLTRTLPEVIGLRADLSLGLVILFASWVAVLPILFIYFCGPEFHSSLFSCIVIALAVAFPFYLAYG